MFSNFFRMWNTFSSSVSAAPFLTTPISISTSDSATSSCRHHRNKDKGLFKKKFFFFKVRFCLFYYNCLLQFNWEMVGKSNFTCSKAVFFTRSKVCSLERKSFFQQIESHLDRLGQVSLECQIDQVRNIGFSEKDEFRSTEKT